MNKYIKQFLASNAAVDVLPIFQCGERNAKEITESFAMLNAAKNYCDNLNDRIVVVIGDGVLPRTGIIFAFYTKAEVYSVDPNFNYGNWQKYLEWMRRAGNFVDRIGLFRNKIEDINIDCFGKDIVVIWPHSHASMNTNSIINYKKRIDIAMPCCVKMPKEWTTKPHIHYEDYEVLSEKRSIYIWK